MIRLAPVAFVLLVLAVVLSSCAPLDFSGPAPAPAPPVVVTVTAPDTGQSVLLTLALVVAFLGIVATAVAVQLWVRERDRRRLTEAQRDAARRALVGHYYGLPARADA